jgi:hypothetical protein
MVADELRRQADTFIELADLAPTIARVHSGPREPAAREGRPGNNGRDNTAEDTSAAPRPQAVPPSPG